jgi:hypothetical protein
LLGRQLCVSDLELPLELDRALHRIHGTGKLRQQVIARRVHYAAVVLLNQRGHELPMGREGADSRHLILAHQAAVAFDIGTEDGGELAPHARPGRAGSLLFGVHRGRLSCQVRPVVKPAGGLSRSRASAQMGPQEPTAGT